jgi:hypothetical protein
MKNLIQLSWKSISTVSESVLCVCKQVPSAVGTRAHEASVATVARSASKVLRCQRSAGGTARSNGVRPLPARYWSHHEPRRSVHRTDFSKQEETAVQTEDAFRHLPISYINSRPSKLRDVSAGIILSVCMFQRLSRKTEGQ